MSLQPGIVSSMGPGIIKLRGIHMTWGDIGWLGRFISSVIVSVVFINAVTVYLTMGDSGLLGRSIRAIIGSLDYKRGKWLLEIYK